MAKTVFSGDMVFHVWAQQTQESGKRSDGRVFFEGRTIYSYGHHFALGYMFPLANTGEHVALLNSDGYSISTSKHKSATRDAVEHKRILYFPELNTVVRILDGLDRYSLARIARLKASPGVTDYEKQFEIDARERWIKQAVAYLEKHALTLNSASGDWLLGLVKPRASFAKIVETAKRKAAIADRKAKETERKNAARRGLFYARMTDSQWAESVSEFVMRLSGQPHAVMSRDVAKCVKAARLTKAQAARMETRLKALRKEGKRVDAIRERGERLANYHKAKEAVRSILGANRDKPAHSLKSRVQANIVATLGQMETGTLRDATRDMFRALNEWGGNKRNPHGLPYVRAATFLEDLDEKIQARRRVLAEIAEREEQAKQAEKLAEWKAGRGNRWDRFTDDHGFAYIRAVDVQRDESGAIIAGKLETSNGADVPLIDAIQVFRMVKLVRERGQGWKRNGAMLPVGHFQVDAISPEGNFQAGCHRFAWGEIERLAGELGVLALAPDNTTVSSH